MNGETLRRAAEQARAEAETHRAIGPVLTKLYGDDCGSEVQARRHLAVADWLDSTASTMAHIMDDLAAVESPPAIEQLVGYDFDEALAVARAYLGEQPC